MGEEAAALAQGGLSEGSIRPNSSRVELRRIWQFVQRMNYAEGLRRALAVLEKADAEEVVLSDRALAARYAGRCELELNRPREALEHLRQAAEWFAEVDHGSDHASH